MAGEDSMPQCSKSVAFVGSLVPVAGIIRRKTQFISQRCYRVLPRPRLLTTCCSSNLEQEGTDGEMSKAKKRQTHVSAGFGVTAMKAAISLHDGDVCAVAEKCAFGFAEAFVQCYNQDDVTSVFVVCGPGMNGLIGLFAARELKARGYHPVVYAIEDNKYTDVQALCERNDISLYDFVPSTLEFYFQVVVDALLGLGYDGGDIRPRLWSVYEMLVSTRLAVVSIDVPSGWDLESGPRRIDVTADTFVKPEVLVSLGAPKNGSKMFAGGFHFLAGRHLPQDYFSEHGVTVPKYPGSEAHCVLISSNPFRFKGNTGEVYGRPGQFNATLFTKNPTREWVDVEEDMDLWDEID